MNDIKKAPMRNPHIQWFHIDLNPNKPISVTIHMVPVTSKLLEAPEMARASQWMLLPPRK